MASAIEAWWDGAVFGQRDKPNEKASGFSVGRIGLCLIERRFDSGFVEFVSSLIGRSIVWLEAARSIVRDRPVFYLGA
ncbi:hypothetical protein [Ensifer canadensis]